MQEKDERKGGEKGVVGRRWRCGHNGSKCWEKVWRWRCDGDARVAELEVLEVAWLGETKNPSSSV